MASSSTSHNSISSITVAAENLSLESQTNGEEVNILPVVGSPEQSGMSFAQVYILLSGSHAFFSYASSGVLLHSEHISAYIISAIHMFV
jgi:hypothetical protein